MSIEVAGRLKGALNETTYRTWFAEAEGAELSDDAFVLGVPIGLLIGYYRGFVSSLIMRLFDFIQSFPVFVLGMALVSVMGQEIWNVAIVLAVLIAVIAASAGGSSEKAATTDSHSAVAPPTRVPKLLQ